MPCTMNPMPYECPTIPPNSLVVFIPICGHFVLPLALCLTLPSLEFTLVTLSRFYEHLPLFHCWPWFAFVVDDLVHHDLVRVLGRVLRIALAPVVADGVGEDGPGVVEAGGGDGASGSGVTLEAMLCILIPEVECAIGAGCAERSVNGVE